MVVSIQKHLSNHRCPQPRHRSAGVIVQSVIDHQLHRTLPRDLGHETEIQKGDTRDQGMPTREKIFRERSALGRNPPGKIVREMLRDMRIVAAGTGTLPRRTSCRLLRERFSQSKVCLYDANRQYSSYYLTSWATTGVLQSIQRDWDFMTDAECIPVHVALSLMDTSTLGKADREPEFLKMYNEIQRTLKSIVNG